MNFTFGIVTGGTEDARVNAIIDTIEEQKIPEYEVIVSGPSSVRRDRTTVLPFDTTQRPHPWITAQKNQITKHAKHDNVVYMHDYIVFEPGWYEGQLKAGDNFAVRMDKMVNPDGARFRDWTLDPFEAKIAGHACLLPYDVGDLSRFMYISGSYWIAKRALMVEFPQHEGLYWGCAEDLEWSSRVRAVHEFSMNTNSSVRLLKQKSPVFGPAHNGHIQALRCIKLWLEKEYDGRQSKQWAGPVPKPMGWE